MLQSWWNYRNSSDFKWGYLRAQEELEARTRCKIKLRVPFFSLVLCDTKFHVSKHAKLSHPAPTRVKISFPSPISDEPSMPRGTLDIICLWGTFPAGFLPSLSNISIKTASKEISWENHNVDGTNPAGIVVLDRNNSNLAGDTFGGLGNTCRVV